MKPFAVTLLAAALLAGCDDMNDIDTVPPAAPRGIVTISLDNAVEIQWLANTEPDVAGYKIWYSDRYDGRYEVLGSTDQTHFVDHGAVNGRTVYYALTAYDFARNESELSTDVVYDTPRPEGLNVVLLEYRADASRSGYDFSTYSVGNYNDDLTDFFYEYSAGRTSLIVWSDSDIQDMGYTGSLDEISTAPVNGWSPTKSAEAIVGHTYVIWTWDDHYAKVRIREVSTTRIVFDWAYQTAAGNTELKAAREQRARRGPLEPFRGPAEE
ncbi:MAG: hypothetical protein MUE68_08925 [Bacteroidetes bacterium]|jgi:hypothetical protein|nr:hypothetical protein [Bacteroidota bacterium]